MSVDVALTLSVLLFAILLLATEALRIDIVALGILLVLPWLGLITAQQAFSGLSSRAVVAMAAVMVLGRGVDRSGLTRGLTRPVLTWAGNSERRLLGAVMTVVGVLSSIMQNIGAAALFMPAVARIARSGGYSVSRLMMPMGFAAILGGTVTMIGSGPLILLGDLLEQRGLAPFGLFAVTPYGLLLLVAGLMLFTLYAPRLLPVRGGGAAPDAAPDDGPTDLIAAWRIDATLHEVTVPVSSGLVGRTRDELDLKNGYGLHLVALSDAGNVLPAPWRHTRFAAGQVLALLGPDEHVARFVAEQGLVRRDRAYMFHALQDPDVAGFAELVVSPRAPVVGQSIRGFALRQTYAVEPVLLLSGGVAQADDFSDRPLRAGDTLLVYGEWQHIAAMGSTADFSVVTENAHEELDSTKRWPAALCFGGAIALALCGFPLALSLATGAMAMVLLGVLPIDSAYRAIDWRTIVLIGGLIPLGVAMQETGAASFLAGHVVDLVEGAPAVVVMTAVAVLATGFSLFMSNVAATVLLVPLIVDLAVPLGLDPRALALLVAVCASNSFILPTHQVNALLLTPGGYRNADYLRAGGWMTLLFLLVAVGAFALVAPA